MSRLLEYIQDNAFRITYLNSRLDIVNYTKINYLKDHKISVSYKEGILVIKGQDLRIQKLLDNEILVVGKLENIEFKGTTHEHE